MGEGGREKEEGGKEGEMEGEKEGERERERAREGAREEGKEERERGRELLLMCTPQDNFIFQRTLVWFQKCKYWNEHIIH